MHRYLRPVSIERKGETSMSGNTPRSMSTDYTCIGEIIPVEIVYSDKKKKSNMIKPINSSFHSESKIPSDFDN